MSLEHTNRETDKNVGNQGQSNRRIDYTQQLAKQKEAERIKSTSEDRTAEEQQQREINESHQRHQNDTDRASQLRAIFGLNFLQDMKGEPAEITGAYDPKQERWIMQEPIQELETPIRPSTRRRTINATWRGTNTGGGRDRDSEQDQRRDMNDD